MMRSRRGQAAEVPPERVFGRLWGRMTDQGWRVMAKPHWFARGDPRTWIYCAPEVLDAAGKLRRDAGELGESIFLDKDDLWTWAQRSGWALPADDDDDATGDREGSPSSADEPDDAAAPTSEHHYYRLCIDHHNRLDASRVEARALAAEAATVPEHVLLSPQSPEAPASAKWKEDDRIEALSSSTGKNTVTTPPRTSTMLMFWKITSASWPMRDYALPPPGTRVAVRFDDGQDYEGTIGNALDERSACQFDDGTSDVIRFPDQDVRVDNATARPPPPPESRVEVLFDDRWYAGTVVGGALDEHRATVFFDADADVFAETGIRVLGTTGELGVGARVALGGKAGKVVELGKRLVERAPRGREHRSPYWEERSWCSPPAAASPRSSKEAARLVRSRAGRQRERRGRRVRAQEHEEAHVRAGARRVVGPRARVGAIAAIEAAAGGGSGGAGGAATAL